MAIAERDADIRRRVAAGEQQAALAREYGLSRQRVGQILRNPPAAARTDVIWPDVTLDGGRRAGAEAHQRAEAAALALTEQGVKQEEIARHYGVSRNIVAKLIFFGKWRRGRTEEG